MPIIVHLRLPENNDKTFFMTNGGIILLLIPRAKKIVAKILVMIKKVASLMTFGIFLVHILSFKETLMGTEGCTQNCFWAGGAP